MHMSTFLAEASLTDFDAKSAAIVLVVFVFVAIILYKTAWKNVLAGLKAREDRIRSAKGAAFGTGPGGSRCASRVTPGS